MHVLTSYVATYVCTEPVIPAIFTFCTLIEDRLWRQLYRLLIVSATVSVTSFAESVKISIIKLPNGVLHLATYYYYQFGAQKAEPIRT